VVGACPPPVPILVERTLPESGDDSIFDARYVATLDI